MTRPQSSTQQFYHAFFRWSALVNGSPFPCHHTRSQLPIHFRSYHVSSTLRTDKIPLRKFDVKGQDWLEVKKSLKQRWRHLPIQSDSDRAYGSLSAGEDVMRFRSSTSILLETAVTEPAFRGLQKRWGDTLERAKKGPQGFVRIGDVVYKNGTATRTLLLSGTEDECAFLLSRGRDKQDRAHSTRELEDALDGASPISVRELPSDQIRPWDYVLRYRSPSTGEVTAEMAIPLTHWDSSVKYRLRLAEDRYSEFDTGSIFGINLRPDDQIARISDLIPQECLMRSVWISGPRRSVAGIIQAAMASLDTLRSDKNDGFPLDSAFSRHQLSQDYTKDSQLSQEIAKTLPLIQGETGCIIRAGTVQTREYFLIGDSEATRKGAVALRREADRIGTQLGYERVAWHVKTTQASKIKQTHESVEDVKAVLRGLTHPVAVVTAKAPRRADNDPNLIRGVTVSSFAAVTLQPNLIFTFNVKIPSRTWTAIRSSRFVGVHFLQASEKGAAIGNAFAQSYDRSNQPFHDLAANGIDWTIYGGDKGDSVPRLQGPSGVLVFIRAKLLLEKCVEVGDHIVAVAQALEIHSSPAEDGSNNPLAYSMQGYREQGKIIEAERLAPAKEHHEEQSEDGKASQATSSTEPVPGSEDVGNQSSSTRAVPGSFQLPQAMTGVISSASTIASRRYSTWGGLKTPVRRSYSSSASHDPSSKVPPSEQGERDVQDMVTEPNLLQSSISEFLGLAPDNKSPPRRMREMLRWREKADKAALRLRKDEEANVLDEYQIADLEETISVNEGRISRVLAHRNALELRRLLDTGAVQHRMLSWYEKSVEKGQAALLDEAKRAKQAFEEQRLGKARYMELLEELKAENAELAEVTARLRDLADDDD